MHGMSQDFTRNYKTAETDKSIDIYKYRPLFFLQVMEIQYLILVPSSRLWPNYVLTVKCVVQCVY